MLDEFDLDHITNATNITILGAPVSGKSYLAKSIVNHLKQTYKSKCITINADNIKSVINSKNKIKSNTILLLDDCIKCDKKHKGDRKYKERYHDMKEQLQYFLQIQSFSNIIFVSSTPKLLLGDLGIGSDYTFIMRYTTDWIINGLYDRCVDPMIYSFNTFYNTINDDETEYNTIVIYDSIMYSYDTDPKHLLR